MAINIVLLKDGREEMIRKFELLVLCLKEEQAAKKQLKENGKIKILHK